MEETGLADRQAGQYSPILLEERGVSALDSLGPALSR